MYMLVLLFLSLQCKKSSDSYGNINHTQQVYDHKGNPGNSAKDFLESTPYTSLQIELQYMPGFQPDPRAIAIFVDLINEKINKPGGIQVTEKEIDPTFKTIFTLTDITDVESRSRTVYTSSDQLGVYILFTSGMYYQGNVVGLAYRNTSIFFFGAELNYFLTGTQEEKIKLMALLLLHEFGHLLGLVDSGTPMVMNHRDKDHGNHCENDKCLMHYTYEGEKWNKERTLPENLIFDSNCSDDLRANGGR